MDNSLCSIRLNWAMFLKKFGREKETKSFSSMYPFTFSKLKSKEYVRGLLVQKVSNLMQAWFTVKGKVEKIGRCPVNELKLFAV